MMRSVSLIARSYGWVTSRVRRLCDPHRLCANHPIGGGTERPTNENYLHADRPNGLRGGWTW